MYPKLTKQDVLDAIGYLLHEYDEAVHIQLFGCLINHKLLEQVDNNFCFNMDRNNPMTDLSGVSLPLTNCYSPSCEPFHPTKCYSPLCPNRYKFNRLCVINCSDSQEQDWHKKEWVFNHYTNTLQTRQKAPKDWIESIPQHLKENTNREELKRQAAIAELILTEQNYVNDLVVLQQIYATPLLESKDIIASQSRRKRFHKNVFGNYLDITRLHHIFQDKLAMSQQSGFFVERVGTLLMEHITNLMEPYIQYASNHIKAIHCITIEQRHNPLFSRFLEQQNAQKCTRRLGLQHYLTSPTLWIGKFKLMIEAILKHTSDDADQLSLQASLTALHDLLCQMNSSASKTSDNDLRFEELLISIYVPNSQNSNEQQLLSIPHQSQLLGEHTLWLARATHPLMPSLCHMFLFSHALVLTHPRVLQNRTDYIVIPGSIIPIPFLTLDSNATTLMRRLSFASTSMVSTPIHLITSLKRQKSAHNVATTKPAKDKHINRRSHSCRYQQQHRAKNTSPWDSPPPVSQPEQSQVVKKNRLFRIKTKFFRFKNKWNATSLSAPVSPVSQSDADGSQESPWACRRESAPAVICSDDNCESNQLLQTKPSGNPTAQQQRRTIKVSHMAYPFKTFRLEFVTRHDRLTWENLLLNAIACKSQESALFKKKMVYRSLLSSSAPLPSTLEASGSSNDSNVGVQNMIEKTRCAFTFVHRSKTTDIQQEMIAIGTQQGIWLGCFDETSSFRCILSGYDVHQIAVFENKLFALIQFDKGYGLTAYSLEFILRPCNEDNDDGIRTKKLFEQSLIEPSNVLCFSIGTIQYHSVFVYLIRKYQSIWLVIRVLDNLISTTGEHLECEMSIKDPTDIQIIEDSVFVRSEKYGIVRVDVSFKPLLVFSSQPAWIFVGSNSALMTLPHQSQHTFVCDNQVVYTVPLFKPKLAVKDFIPKIKFESQVSQTTRVNHYLVGFSPTTIEIRDTKTCELFQVIKGTHIKLISTPSHHTQPILFIMTSSKNPHATSMYQLVLPTKSQNTE
ncbi:Rho1 guanine nucleotide exchange factor 1 [Choanephora cucurbitarum]|uniref:Rho1 guanine nucleotide exchange factor 1 n=1 Tax=Choanephora cucurbitarum TaxID=101091 RepID=A0A1C7N649_9FUNG|nr:Rho1 guanine nucleotide exchange factor 1 [Choanephora cucurbitarum]